MAVLMHWLTTFPGGSVSLTTEATASVMTDMTVHQCGGSVTAYVTACQCDGRCDSASA